MCVSQILFYVNILINFTPFIIDLSHQSLHWDNDRDLTTNWPDENATDKKRKIIEVGCNINYL